MANGTEQLQNTDYDYLIKFLALGDSGMKYMVRVAIDQWFPTGGAWTYRGPQNDFLGSMSFACTR